MPKWSAQHYNALAKEIREMHKGLLSSARDTPNDRTIVHTSRFILDEFALRLARRFKEDSERFDPIRFLDACSPDPDLYPLSELWDETKS